MDPKVCSSWGGNEGECPIRENQAFQSIEFMVTRTAVVDKPLNSFDDNGTPIRHMEKGLFGVAVLRDKEFCPVTLARVTQTFSLGCGSIPDCVHL